MLDDLHAYLVASVRSMGADHCMEEHEGQEEPIVVQSDTLVDPDAMMVKLLHAVTTDAAVFGPRRFLMLTSATVRLLLKKDTIKFEALQCLDGRLLV